MPSDPPVALPQIPRGVQIEHIAGGRIWRRRLLLKNGLIFRPAGSPLYFSSGPGDGEVLRFFEFAADAAGAFVVALFASGLFSYSRCSDSSGLRKKRTTQPYPKIEMA